MTFIVQRQIGQITDYLTGFDPIWGPVWCMARRFACAFDSEAKAARAMDDAIVICRPRPWLVPDFGFKPTLIVEHA